MKRGMSVLIVLGLLAVEICAGRQGVKAETLT